MTLSLGLSTAPRSPLQSPPPLALPDLASRNKPKEGQLHLRFQLPAIPGQPPLDVLMSMGLIQEVLSLSVQRLSPMPNMLSAFLGLMNRGNRIFWLVDLGALLGVSRLAPNASEHSVVIVRAGSAALGLAVAQVQNMMWVTETQLQPASNIPHELAAPYISQVCAWDDQSCWVLDAQRILQSPLFEHLKLAG
ncbi:MAG: hypothetical protein HC824_02625 [Synechococcales cyanobacterium RM1_1_8]|nr:hypothetical protein [Synechococcales cyanobacterium RM1_1_8]